VARLGVPLLGSVPNVPGEEIVTTIRDPKSTVSEAYMSVQTNLSFLTEHGIPKSLMMTSTREAEGKSTSAIALATLLSRMGRRVMLIDADMRSPSVDSMLSVGNELGLSNYLSGTDDWRSLVKSVEALGLDFITTGPMPPNSAELLSTHRMGSLIEALTEHYDVVIIDSPPVLGLADAPLIATTCEGVVYAIEANRVKSRGIATAMDRLRRSNAQIFGAILTKLDKHALSFGYGYGYGHGYGYGKEGREGEAGRS
jgi:capsular exopolysaccharide synthesis family protein